MESIIDHSLTYIWIKMTSISNCIAIVNALIYIYTFFASSTPLHTKQVSDQKLTPKIEAPRIPIGEAKQEQDEYHQY
jgi:hypothetical protein